MQRYSVRTNIIIVTFIAIAVALISVGVIFKVSRDPAEESFRKAAILIAEGRKQEADSILQIIIEEYPKSEYAKKAESLLRGSKPIRPISEIERLFREARSYYPLGSGSRTDLEKAAEKYLSIADNYSEDALARESLFEAAQCYDQLGRYQDAIKLWKRFTEKYSTDGRTAEVLYALGYIHFTQLNQIDEGKYFFDELLKKFPNSSSAEAAKIFIENLKSEKTKSTPGRPSVLTEPGKL